MTIPQSFFRPTRLFCCCLKDQPVAGGRHSGLSFTCAACLPGCAERGGVTHCIRCGRPMKHASPSGLGPVCARRLAQAPAAACDLFGFRPEVYAQQLADKVLVEIGRQFAAARRRLGMWA